jgi:ABC-type branched-subunit amino acid transport system substrate-binding protein
MRKTKIIGMAIAMLAAGGFGPSLANAQDYKIGYITDLSGPLAGSYTPTWQGFDLYTKALNARGGIDGRKVAVTIDDDGLRADRAVAAAKKQVESNDVLGIFGLSLSSTQAPVIAEMQKVGVPVVSTFSAILDALPPAKKFYFSTGVMFEVAGEAIGVLQKQIAPRGKVVGVTFDSVGGRAAMAHNKLAVQKEGYTWDEVIFPVRTADFTPFAQTVAGMEPAMVVGHYGAEQNIGMIAALRAAGYSGPYVIAAYGASEDTARQAAAQAGSGDNIYMVSRYAVPTDDAPGMADLLAAARKFGIAEPTSMHVTGWALGMFTEQALKSCGAHCTREGLDKAIQGIKLDTKGLTGGPIEMSADNHYGPTYWRLYHWQKDKLVGMGDWLKKTDLAFPLK